MISINNNENKVAVMTGGSRGIGAAVAPWLAEEGVDVALTCQRGAEAAATVVEKQGRRAAGIGHPGRQRRPGRDCFRGGPGGAGITVNQVDPGPIDTDLNPADGPTAATAAGCTALGRYGTPAEVAATVAHLAGDDGTYVNGAMIAVDGGFNI